MRANGVRSLDVSCWNCHHRAIRSAAPTDDVPVPTFGPRGGAREPDGRSMAVILHAAASQVEDYFGQATAPTNVSLSGPTTCDGVGVAGDFGRGSEIVTTQVVLDSSRKTQGFGEV